MNFATSRRAVFALALPLLACSLEARSSTRTVQFAGLGGAEITTPDINNDDVVIYCTVMIANTTNTTAAAPAGNVYVSAIGFIDYSLSGDSTDWQVLTSTPPPVSSTLVLSTVRNVGGVSNCSTLTTPAGCVGAGSPILPGGWAIYRFPTNSFPFDGRYAACSGYVTVVDSVPSTPGTVSAAGSITYQQEVQVVGGVLSGAYYDTSAHVIPGSANLAGDPAGFSVWDYGGGSNMPTLNMNLYCNNACAVYMAGGANPGQTANSNYCAAICGGGSTWNGATPYPPSNNNWGGAFGAGTDWPTLNIDSLIGNFHDVEDVTAVRQTYTAAGGTSSGIALCSINFIGPPVCTCSALATDWSGTYTATPNNIKPDHNPPMQYSIKGNAHYAGGIVHEMIMGPLTNICSANASFWALGGSEFTHADGVDGHAIIDGTDGGPPERLVCNHRHSKDDLYMRASYSASFVINGGMAF